MKTDRFIFQRRLLYGIMALGFLILVITNALTWAYQQRLKTVIMNDTELKLQSIARMASDLIDPQDLSLLLPENGTDTGPGIPALMTESIFEPFFSTKAQGSSFFNHNSHQL
jgi:nitrogen-specific signal transduction histidine kinase